MLAASLYEGLI